MNELMNLLYLPMTDEKIIDKIDSVGLEQPIIDEQYEMDLCIDLIDDDNSGLSFTFEELDGYSIDGDPCLSVLSVRNKKDNILPFNLQFSDNYEISCEKLGKKADFINEWSDDVRLWLVTNDNNDKLTLAINYKDDDLNELNYIVLGSFKESYIGDTLIPNKD